MHSILDVYSRYRRDLKIQRCADEPRELRHRSYGNRSVGDPPNIVNTARVPPTREFVNNRDSNFLCTTEESVPLRRVCSITVQSTIRFIHEREDLSRQVEVSREEGATWSCKLLRLEGTGNVFCEGERDCCTLMKMSFYHDRIRY